MDLPPWLMRGLEDIAPAQRSRILIAASDADDPAAYVATSLRHAQVTRRRRHESMLRRVTRAAVEREVSEHEERLGALLRAEWDALRPLIERELDEARPQRRAQVTHRKWLDALGAKAIDELREEDADAAWPGVSRSCRYQWVRRAREAIEGMFMSDALRRRLTCGAHQDDA